MAPAYKLHLVSHHVVVSCVCITLLLRTCSLWAICSNCPTIVLCYMLWCSGCITKRMNRDIINSLARSSAACYLRAFEIWFHFVTALSQQTAYQNRDEHIPKRNEVAFPVRQSGIHTICPCREMALLSYSRTGRMFLP